MESWYATTDIFKYPVGERKTFYCLIKSNRKVDDTHGKEPYKQVQQAFWSDADVVQGRTIKLHKMPLDTYFKLFRVLVSPTRTDYIITDVMAQDNTDAAEKAASAGK